MGKLGGYRPGSGRPKGLLGIKRQIELEAKERMVKRVAKDWSKLVNVLLEKALGKYYVEGTTKAGSKIIYQVEPDIKAATTLIEYVIGKPKQTIDNNIDGRIESASVDNLAASIQAILQGKALLKPTPTQNTKAAPVTPNKKTDNSSRYSSSSTQPVQQQTKPVFKNATPLIINKNILNPASILQP